MHAAVVGAHTRQGVDVGRFDLRELAVAQHERGKLVHLRQLLEHARIGGVAALVLLERREADHLEEDVRELLGGIEVERLPRKLVDLRGDRVEVGLGARTELRKTGRIERGAGALHHAERRHEWQIDLVVHPRAAVLLERVGEHCGQGARHCRMDRRALGVGLRLGHRAAEVHLGESLVGVGRGGRVEHVRRKRHVEGIHRGKLRVGHEGLLRGVGGIHPVDRILHVERRERARAHDARHDVERAGALEHGGTLRGGEGSRGALGEQRRLLRLLERHADALARRQRLLDKRARRRLVGHERLVADLGLGSGGLRPHEREHAGERMGERVLAERRFDVGRLEGGKRQLVDVEREIKIGHDRGDAPRQARHVLVVLKVLELLALELGEVVVDALHRTEPLQQLRRGLRTDARHAGDVVGRVAHKPEEVGELLGCDAVLLEHLSRPVDHHVGDAALGGDDAREVGGELAGVLVARDEQRLEAVRLVARGDGAEDVVALPAGNLHHGHAH